LSAEISTCCSIHTSVDVVLSGEISRGFGSIETTVSTKESMAESRENSIDSKLSSAISSEASSRVSKDGSLEFVISEAKTSINTAMTAEASSRVSGDVSLATAINTEKGRIDAILDGSTVNLDQFAEIVSFVNGIDLENDNALLSAVTSIGIAIDDEETARENADDSLESALGSAALSLNGKINTEISNRENAEDSLELVISTNKLESDQADQSLATALGSTELFLNGKINTETTNRVSADDSLESALESAQLFLNGKINTEISRAEAAEDSLEAALSTEVANLLANTDLTAIDSFSEVVSELETVNNMIDVINNTYFKKVSVSGLVNGTNKNFTLASAVRPNSETIYYNGLLQEEGVDYTISGGVNVQFTYTPKMGGKVTAYGVYA
jgi:hypothetical protein